MGMATEAPPTEDRRGAPAEERRRTFHALKERDFAVYFSGDMGFFMAMQMNLILRGYLAVELTGQATAIGIVSPATAWRCR